MEHKFQLIVNMVAEWDDEHGDIAPSDAEYEASKIIGTLLIKGINSHTPDDERIHLEFLEVD